MLESLGKTLRLQQTIYFQRRAQMHNDKVTHMLALIDEIDIIKSRIEPQDCGHMHTTVNMLESRVQELKKELQQWSDT